MPKRKSSRAAVNTTVDPIESDSHVTRRQGLALWTDAAKPLQGSRQRMKDAEDISLGNTRLVPPKYLTRSDSAIADLIPTLAARKTLVLNMTNSIAEDRPIIERMRPPKGGPATEGRAEETETAVSALITELFPWDASVGRSVQQAEYSIVTLLAEDAWDASPDPDDILTEADWKKLPEKERRTYRKAEAKDGGSSYKRPKQVYWRDADGKGVEADDYGRRDSGKTRKAYEDALADHMAAHPPFVIRGYSAFDSAPVWGSDGLEMLAIRQLMEPSQLLLKGYRCTGLAEGEDGKARVLIPTGFDAQMWGKGGKIYLYQFILKIAGDPCIMYMVGGQDTTIVQEDGEEIEAVINLRKKWGFSRLPCGTYYGLNLQTDNPDDRPVPFMDPLGPAMLAMEGLLGSTIMTAWRRGTSKYLVTPDPNMPTAAYLDGNNNLKPLDMDPNNDIVIGYGLVSHLAPLETSNDTKWAAEQLGGSIQDATPAPAASGSGAGADSGRAAALLHTYAQSANRMIPEGLRKATEDSASMLLEWACCYMRTKGLTEIPYYANVDAEPQEGETPSGQQTIMVRLREDWIGKNYKVTARYLPSSNPILVQQAADLYEKGLGSFEDVQEAKGKTNSLRERLRIIDDAYWRSEQGMNELNAIDARKRGDIEKAKVYEALAAQQAAALAVGPDGKPTAAGPAGALDPAFQSQGGGGPTTAQRQLAGTLSGGRGADMTDAATTAGAPAPAGVGMPNTGGM